MKFCFQISKPLNSILPLSFQPLHLAGGFICSPKLYLGEITPSFLLKEILLKHTVYISRALQTMSWWLGAQLSSFARWDWGDLVGSGSRCGVSLAEHPSSPTSSHAGAEPTSLNFGWDPLNPSFHPAQLPPPAWHSERPFFSWCSPLPPPPFFFCLSLFFPCFSSSHPWLWPHLTLGKGLASPCMHRALLPPPRVTSPWHSLYSRAGDCATAQSWLQTPRA